MFNLSCQSVTCSFAYGVSKNIRFSDVNFINTWLTTPSIFLGSLPGFIYDQLIFTVKGQIWASVIWRVHRKNPKNNIICLCCKFFLLTNLYFVAKVMKVEFSIFRQSVFSYLCPRATVSCHESPGTSLLSLPFFINISRFSGWAVFLSKDVGHYLKPINNLLILFILSLKSLSRKNNESKLFILFRAMTVL